MVDVVLENVEGGSLLDAVVVRVIDVSSLFNIVSVDIAEAGDIVSVLVPALTDVTDVVNGADDSSLLGNVLVISIVLIEVTGLVLVDVADVSLLLDIPLVNVTKVSERVPMLVTTLEDIADVNSVLDSALVCATDVVDICLLPDVVAISLLDVALADVTAVDNGAGDSSLLDSAWIIATALK